MLPIAFIREKKEQIILSLKKRNYDNFDILDEIIKVDDKRKNLQHQLESHLAESNKISKEIGQLY